jgi:hypothetical protein
MATSDSEDFESADEDIETGGDHTVLCSASKEKESDAQSKKEECDNEKKKDLGNLIKNDIGSGELQEGAHVCKKYAEAFDSDNNVDTLDNAHIGAASSVNISNEACTKYNTKDRQRAGHVKRQQKSREPKSGGSVRKLGTKISSSVLHTSSESESEKVKQDLLVSEKCDKTSKCAFAETHDETEGKSIQNPSYRMENLKQDVGNLSVGSRKHDIAPVLDNVSQSASEKVCESNL